MKETLKEIFPYVLAFVVVIAFIKLTSVPTEGDIYKETARKTFRLLNPDNQGSGGTGFYLKSPQGKTFLISNQHVCDVSKRPYMVSEQGNTKRRAQILDIAEHTDLCILEAPSEARGLELASDALGFEKVFVVGHPLLYPVTISAGYLNTRGEVRVSYCHLTRGNLPKSLLDFSDLFTPDCIKTIDSYGSSARTAPGNSGSPVVNAYGKVVGVLFAGDSVGWQSRIIPLDVLTEYVSNF